MFFLSEISKMAERPTSIPRVSVGQYVQPSPYSLSTSLGSAYNPFAQFQISNFPRPRYPPIHQTPSQGMTLPTQPVPYPFPSSYPPVETGPPAVPQDVQNMESLGRINYPTPYLPLYSASQSWPSMSLPPTPQVFLSPQLSQPYPAHQTPPTLSSTQMQPTQFPSLLSRLVAATSTISEPTPYVPPPVPMDLSRTLELPRVQELPKIQTPPGKKRGTRAKRKSPKKSMVVEHPLLSDMLFPREVPCTKEAFLGCITGPTQCLLSFFPAILPNQKNKARMVLKTTPTRTFEFDMDPSDCYIKRQNLYTLLVPKANGRGINLTLTTDLNSYPINYHTAREVLNLPPTPFNPNPPDPPPKKPTPARKPTSTKRRQPEEDDTDLPESVVRVVPKSLPTQEKQQLLQPSRIMTGPDSQPVFPGPDQDSPPESEQELQTESAAETEVVFRRPNRPSSTNVPSLGSFSPESHQTSSTTTSSTPPCLQRKSPIHEKDLYD